MERSTLSASVAHVHVDERQERLEPGAYVRLVVADTGTGMDAETLARACEPFFTTKPQGRGTGLGLAMARSFAEGSGGVLAIDSAPDAGTRVSIWLPITGDPVHPASVLSAEEGARQSAPRSAADRRASVLLVDDEPAVRMVLAQELVEDGFDVVDAADGIAALALLDRPVPVDFLISDLAMPGMDGVALIREARRRRPGLPAILLTGYVGEAAVLAVGGALDRDGSFALLRKPVTGTMLSDQVAALLGAPAGLPSDPAAVDLR